jgi:hypothetical protein
MIAAQRILYGAETSLFFPGQTWGGMTADTAIYTQAALGLDTLLPAWDPAGLNQWRIFSKLGTSVVVSMPREYSITTCAEILSFYLALLSIIVGVLVGVRVVVLCCC